jgi:hypothetical protein
MLFISVFKVFFHLGDICLSCNYCCGTDKLLHPASGGLESALFSTYHYFERKSRKPSGISLIYVMV